MKDNKAADPAAPTMEQLQLELKDTFDRLRCTEVIAASSRRGDIRLMFKVVDDARWYKILSFFLSKEREKPWYSFIGRKYVIDKTGNTGYAWVAIFEADDIASTVKEVRSLLLEAGSSAGPVVRTRAEQVKPGSSDFSEGSISVPVPWKPRASKDYMRGESRARR
jgi:hypothetical protein